MGGRGVTVTQPNFLIRNTLSQYNMDLCDSQLPLVENEVLNLSDFGHDNEGMFKVINFKYFLRLILNIKYNRILTVSGKI